MTTNYTATVDVAGSTVDEKTAVALVEKLTQYHPAIGSSPTGQLSATISFPAENLRQAIDTAISVVTAAAGAEAVALELLTTAEFNKREGFATMPELIGTTEFAELMGISRVRVNQMLNEGKLTTAKRVGGTHVIAMSEAIAKAKAAGRDVSHLEQSIV